MRGKPAFYTRYEIPELRRELCGPWTAVYQTESGMLLERRPDPKEQRTIRHVFRPDQVLTPEGAQEYLDSVCAQDERIRPRVGDYVAVVFDHHEVVKGFVMSASACYAQVLMDDGSTGRWVPPEYRRHKQEKKVTRQCNISNMLVLARAADEKAA